MSTSEYEPIDYVKINYKTLPRRKIQPTGHSKIYFQPNPRILPEKYKEFDNARLVLEAAKNVSSINVVDFDNMRSNFQMLSNIILNGVVNGSCCKGISPNYVNNRLKDNYGILYIIKRDINNDNMLVFATIRLLADNKYNNERYLELDLICANSQYKNMGTKLLNSLVDLAIQADCKYIHLEALDGVVEFYKKYGFVLDNSMAIKEQGFTRMEYKILSEQEYKTTEKYKENYETLQEFGGSKKRRKTNKRKNKKRKNKKRRTIKLRYKRI
jgi:hypothetical protein